MHSACPFSRARSVARRAHSSSVTSPGEGLWVIDSMRDACDNAMAESFLATLKSDLRHQSCFHPPEEARCASFRLLAARYNTRRRRSSPGYQAPIIYEGRHHAAA